MTSPLVVMVGLATADHVMRVSWPIERGGRHVAREAIHAGGGVAANAAVASARLGVATAFVGQIGDDAPGRELRAELEREGVDAGCVRIVVGGRTPASTIVVDDDGERTILHDPGDLPPLTLDEPALDRCRRASWLHLDSLGWSALPALREAGVAASVSLDAGNPIGGLAMRGIGCYAPTERALAQRYPGVSVDEAAGRALDEGAERVVVTMGAAGSVAFERRRGHVERTAVAAAAVQVRSVLGAGDVFHGALVAAFARGLPLPAALRLANAAAALSTRGLDARSAIPGWDEAQRLAAGPLPVP